MAFLRPDWPVRRILYGYVLIGIWVSCMYAIWVIHPLPPFQLIGYPHGMYHCGMFGAMCASWKFGRVYHIHWVPFILSTVLSLIISMGLIWLDDQFIKHGIRRRFFSWRQIRRFERGLCVTCGYVLKDLPRCPECGTFREEP